MELDFSPWGNCKRRRREAAIAEDKKPLATKDFEHFMPKGVHFAIFLISYLLTIKSKNNSWSGGQRDENDDIFSFKD